MITRHACAVLTIKSARIHEFMKDDSVPRRFAAKIDNKDLQSINVMQPSLFLMHLHKLRPI